MYDIGFMTMDTTGQDREETEFEVRDVKLQGGFVVHLGTVATGSLRVGDVLKLQIDEVGDKGALMVKAILIVWFLDSPVASSS